MMHHFDHKDEEPMPTNITCPWDSCTSNIRGYCHGIVKLVAGNIEEFDSIEECYFTRERLVCANYQDRRLP